MKKVKLDTVNGVFSILEEGGYAPFFRDGVEYRPVTQTDKVVQVLHLEMLDSDGGIVQHGLTLEQLEEMIRLLKQEKLYVAPAPMFGDDEKEKS